MGFLVGLSLGKQERIDNDFSVSVWFLFLRHRKSVGGVDSPKLRFHSTFSQNKSDVSEVSIKQNCALPVFLLQLELCTT